MTEAVDYPAPVVPPAVADRDPSTFPEISCDTAEAHDPHVWIGAWNHGDDDPRRCPGVM